MFLYLTLLSSLDMIGNIIIHIFDEESRGYYRLEDIWTGAVKASTADEVWICFF